MKPGIFRLGLILLLLLTPLLRLEAQETQPIDFGKAQQLISRVRNGETLTSAEAAYLERARAARRQQMQGRPQNGAAQQAGKTSVGLTPLTDMSAQDVYQGEHGGLYGDGENVPPESQQLAADQLLAAVKPLNAAGKPAEDGKVVLISISMSNATQEFQVFKRLADSDPGKAKNVTIVDCAQGGQAMAEWASPAARPWQEAQRRLKISDVTDDQVQFAWIKLANKSPQGDLEDHGRKLYSDTLAVVQNAKAKFPNLKIIYLSSRTYGGYATNALNPEPYAYDGAFVARWLIQAQIKGDAALNADPAHCAVKAPLLLWGPYLWADGEKGRKLDNLIWKREDFRDDGTHPSSSGTQKVARLMLDFFETDPLAKSWFANRNTK